MSAKEEGAAPAAPGRTATESWAPGGVRGGAGPWPVQLPKEGDLLGGRFLLKRLLGAGATGVVFEALDHVTGQVVALKVLRPEAVRGSGLERLQREVRLSRPGHPHVVRLNDLHEADGLLLLSMELVAGESLAGRLSGAGPLGLGTAVSLGRQVAGALAYLHANGLVHRDVKPGNILLAGDGMVKLCDLGLLRPVEHGLTVTMTEVVLGTPAYMAPEQGAGKELTGATDVYALGLTLWEALTGKVPLSGSTAVETLTRRQRESPPRLRPLRPEVPRWLESLLRRMLSPRPEDRPASAEVESALGAGRYRPLPRARTLAAALVALVVFAGAAWGARSLLSRGAVRYESEGSVVRGVDARGRPLFTHRLENPVHQLLEVDLDGDGAREAVAAAYSPVLGSGRTNEVPASEVTVLDARGRLRTRLRAEEATQPWTHPFHRAFRVAVQPFDLDADGASELVVNATHPTFYPAGLFVYWSKAGVWEHVLDHWGHIYSVNAVHGQRPRLRFVAVNNALGFALVLGEIEVVPRERREPTALIGPLFMSSPGLADKGGGCGRWVAYTLLTRPEEPGISPDGLVLEVRPDGGSTLRIASDVRSFDVRGNPDFGPNGGRDLSALRIEFVTGDVLVSSRSRSSQGPGPVLRQRERLAERFRPLLGEPAYRLAFDFEMARQLAAVRAPGEAASLLTETVRMFPTEEASYQLAGFLALAGDLEASAAILKGMISTRRGVRVGFDAPSLLLRVAAEHGRGADVDVAIEYLAHDGDRQAVQPGLGPALRARANLLRDQVAAADAGVRSWAWAEDGDALAVLARWRLGRSRPGDVGAMKAHLGSGDEGEKEDGIAYAAALLAAGRGGEAVPVARELVAGLEWDARKSLERRQQHLLAKAILAKALLASGEAASARETARAVLAESRPGLIWTNLANEVLAEAGVSPNPAR